MGQTKTARTSDLAPADEESEPGEETEEDRDSSFSPDKIDPEKSTPVFKCRICGYENKNHRAVAQHITRKDDSSHKDRNGFNDQGLIETEGNELLAEWNERTESDGDGPDLYDDVDYQILFEVWKDPDATQREIADRVGLVDSTVGSRLEEMGYGWSDRMEKVEEMFPETSTEAGYTDDTDEDTDTAADEKSDGETLTGFGSGDASSSGDGAAADSDRIPAPDRVHISLGNKSDEGPSTGIDMTGGSGSDDTLEQAALRLESFDGLSSKQQASIIAMLLYDDDAPKTKVAHTAGVHDTYLSKSTLPRHVKSIHDALERFADENVITLGDLLERFDDDHDHNLEQVLNVLDYDDEPAIPIDAHDGPASASEQSEKGRHPQQGEVGADGRTDGKKLTLELTQEEAFQLLMNSSGPEPVLRRLYIGAIQAESGV